ncbi:hypothetical protein PVK06_024302 [Gossypium arboreum]|uniref:Uncharacterized protein n=1 Tax=Gossypium arboreum TaxID=29729 RepID=A0ABR0PDS1_GOSAR|nr:hypothetical protein PVK06_024302 [Gossypium arboreum]
MIVDASKNEALFSKSNNDAYEIIERIANNNYQWPTNRAASEGRVVGVHKADTLASLAAQVSSMSPMLKNITVNGFNGNLTENLRSTCKEHCKTATLQSGKTLEPKVVEVQDEPVVAQDK